MGQRQKHSLILIREWQRMVRWELALEHTGSLQTVGGAFFKGVLVSCEGRGWSSHGVGTAVLLRLQIQVPSTEKTHCHHLELLCCIHLLHLITELMFQSSHLAPGALI